ncbi:hypothetical protein M413DRAFT_74849 [Hebeloma cylindrosporum]|uniref:G domain-containing protein n=1 Tax=Hebeloma cylindrosporum TaxID=76867 RepID=A0A0C2YF06_HEBCY|nr:hypothetical protein M413DRAFT_74849 [Hebeloma cylindrosporum h7]
MRSGNSKDNPLKDGKRTDIVIPVMGPTGAGKSTYINYVLNDNKLVVGHSVNSSTTDICPVIIDHIPDFPGLKGRRLILMDTPGFDDTFVDDVEILKRIANWLAASYRKHMPIGGVLYLHDISLKRFTGTARRNLEMFRHLCGDDALEKVVFVTTSWQMDATDEREVQSIDDRERRELQLTSTHWKPTIDAGAEVRRFLGNKDSAWEILNIFLRRADHRPVDIDHLLIQQEMVDDRLLVPDTEAGKALLFALQQTLLVHNNIQAATARGDRDPEAEAELDEARARMHMLEEQIQSLKGSLPQRLLKWLRMSVRGI